MANNNVRLQLANYLLGSLNGGRNYVQNQAAFLNTANVSAAGSATVTRNTTTPLTAISDFSISLPNNATDGVTWTLDTLDRSMNGNACELTFDYTASSIGSNVRAQVLQGSNVVSQSDPLQVTSTSRRILVVAPCGDLSVATTVRIQNDTGNTGTSAMNVANVSYGRAMSIGTVSQAQLIGRAFIAGSGGCTWTRASTALGAFGTVSLCPGPTVPFNPGPGLISTTDTDLPQITVTNLPAGTYKITATLSAGSSISANSQIAIWDGTSYSGRQSFNSNNTTIEGLSVVGVFTYGSAQASVTFAIHGSVSTGTLSIVNDTASAEVAFTIERFPTASETVYAAPVTNWRVDANIGGANPSLGTTSVSTYTEITSASLDLVQNAGSIPVGIACSGTNASTVGSTTCSVGNESVGVTFNAPTAGDVRACVAFSHSMFSNIGANHNGSAIFQIVETPSNAQTILQEGKAKVVSGISTSPSAGVQPGGQFPHRLCGTFRFDSAGQKTLRLMYEQNTSTGLSGSSIKADRAGADGQADIHWDIQPITAAVPAPNLVGLGMLRSTDPTWGSVRYTPATLSTFSTTSGTYVNANITGLHSTAVTRGFATVPTTAGDAGVRIETLPPGTYTVIANGYFDIGITTNCKFAISDGTTRANSSFDAVGAGMTASFGTLIGQFSYSSAGTRTFTIQAMREAGSNSCSVSAAADGNSTSTNDRPGIQLQVIPVGVGVTSIFPSGSVSSNTGGQERIERAVVAAGAACAASPCTVSFASTSGWLSVTRTTTGDYVFSYPGIFSARPTCTFSVAANRNGIGSQTATSTNLLTFNSAGAAIDASDMNVICMGPR